jgi:hypothetical protein
MYHGGTERMKMFTNCDGLTDCPRTLPVTLVLPLTTSDTPAHYSHAYYFIILIRPFMHEAEDRDKGKWRGEEY